jgi:superfamily II DNA or RNA helicase
LVRAQPNESFYERRGIITTADRAVFVEIPKSILKPVRTEELAMHRLVIANAHKFSPHADVNLADIPNDIFDLIIVDEAHHYPARTWKGILQESYIF